MVKTHLIFLLTVALGFMFEMYTVVRLCVVQTMNHPEVLRFNRGIISVLALQIYRAKSVGTGEDRINILSYIIQGEDVSQGVQDNSMLAGCPFDKVFRARRQTIA